MYSQHQQTFQRNMERANERAQARHSKEHPKHVRFLCMDLMGMIDSCIQAEKRGGDGQRWFIRAMLPIMRGLLDELERDTR